MFSYPLSICSMLSMTLVPLAEINGDLNYHINPGPQTSE